MKNIFTALGIILATMVLSYFVFTEGFTAGQKHTKQSIQQTTNETKPLDRYEIYELVNEHRVEKGLQPLVFDPVLCSFAKVRLSEIHTNWSHEGFTTEIQASYYNYTYGGENLARYFFSEEDTVTGWVNSPSHHENIVDPNFTRTCIESELFNSDTYTVQHFASY